MVDRSVLVTLRANVGDFKAQMEVATKATKGVGDQTKKTQQEASTALGQIVRSASQHADAWERTGLAVGSAGAVIAGGVLLAVDAFADFDQAMSRVESSTHESTENMSALRAAALEAGADTAYSATEAAGAVDELAKAGVSTADVLDGGLSGALSLAAAGELDVAESAEIAATALTQFKLEGSDVGHVADLLAAGAGKAQGSVHDLGMALNQGGLVASQMGLSIEETTGTLAAFAAAGLVGSDAGTSLKSMLLMLANPTEKSAGLMRELGINAYDASGSFVGMENLAGQLQTRLSGLTQEQRDSALATIFGADAIRAAGILYTQGADGVAQWVMRVDDAGYAATTAAIKMDNLRGDLEFLRGAFDTALINTGSGGNDFLRAQVQALTDLVDAYNELPAPVQQGLLAIAGVGAVTALAGGAFLALAPRVLETISGFRQLTTDSPKAADGLGKTARAAGVVGAALAGLALAGAVLPEAADNVSSMAQATALLADQSTGIAELDARIASLGKAGYGGDRDGFASLREGLENLVDPSFVDRVSDFGDVLAATLTGGSLGSSDGRQERAALVGELEAMGEGLAQLVGSGAPERAAEQFALISEQAAAAGLSQEQLLDLMPAYRDALEDQDTQQSLAATSGESLASTVTGIAEQTEDAADASEKFSDALDSLLAQFFDVDAAADAFQSSLLDIADAAKKNGSSLEGNTREAIANRAAMRDSADAAADLLRAMAQQGASSDEIAAKAAELKTQFLDQARAAGFTGAEVDKVAAAYDAMPRLVQTQLVAQGLDGVRDALDGVLRRVSQLDGRSITTYFDVKGTGAVASTRAGVAVARADGGLIPYGLGGPREDNVLAAVSSGEFVVNAAQTSKYRGLLEAINDGSIPAFADGGLVGGRAAAAGTLAGTTVSAAYLSSALGATPGPVGEERYAAALAASALAADSAAAAETRLENMRARSAAFLDQLSAANERAEARSRAQGEARVQAMEDELDALRERQDDASFAYRRRQADEMDALRKRTKDEGALKAAQRRQEDAERAFSKAQAAEVEAAQQRIAAAKEQNKAATEALARANEASLKSTKESLARREADAEEDLTEAKENAKAATEELKDAEDELAQARQRALAVAEQVSEALMRNATLSGAYGDRSAAQLRESTSVLQEASAAAEDAARNARGEDEAGALARRAGALEKLAGAAKDYAAAQEAMGVDAAAIGAGLDQVSARIRDLGAAYGLTEAQVSKLTGSLQTQRTSGQDVLESLQRELARTSELAGSVRQLQGAGLDSKLLDQVISGGTGTGLQLARAILGGGAGLIGQLNATQAALTATANGLGVAIAAARYSPTGSSSTSTTLDPASVALLEQAIASAASNVPTVLLDGEKISRNVVQRQADASYAGRAS